ncbi:MAG TPA: histidine kinase, partial [Sphingomicrobium sp.]|nr:histidine kinase [Sphingomicrobium sp.]
MTSGTATVVIILAAFWVAIAALLLIMAIRRTARANAILASARSTSALLRAAPARPLLVHRDGKVEIDSQLQRDLGLAEEPKTIDQLAGQDSGIRPDDLEGLKADIAAAAIGGPPVERQVRVAGSDRVLEVRGGLAASPWPAGTLLLWLFDTSGAEAERVRLVTQLGQTEMALDSLTHLIESAPFPMWYRGPDMSLGLVNSAFVAAVEARDAAEVIARGSELIDSPGEDSARAGALAALEAGRPYVRTQPATIGGERRMLKLVDVPLPTGAVAGFA